MDAHDLWYVTASVCTGLPYRSPIVRIQVTAAVYIAVDLCFGFNVDVFASLKFY